MDEKEYYSFAPDEVENIDVIWSESGYKQINVQLKNGKSYTVESDS